MSEEDQEIKTAELSSQDLRSLTDPLEIDKSDAILKKAQSPKEILKTWNVEIKFLDQGALVYVGCKSFAFESIEKALDEIKSYTEDPQFFVDKYN